MRQSSSDTQWEAYSIINSNGELLEIAEYDSYGGVRPAMYLNCLGLFNAGTGSKEDPFRRE